MHGSLASSAALRCLSRSPWWDLGHAGVLILIGMPLILLKFGLMFGLWHWGGRPPDKRISPGYPPRHG
jgi:hypothetical protein